mgnify:CR=1 FL=1
MKNQPNAVGAIGHIDVYPNSRNVIPGKAVFTVDFRSPELDVITDMENRWRVAAEDIVNEMGLQIEFEKVGGFGPVKFDEGCVAAVRDAAGRLGYSLWGSAGDFPMRMNWLRLERMKFIMTLTALGPVWSGFQCG